VEREIEGGRVTEGGRRSDRKRVSK